MDKKDFRTGRHVVHDLHAHIVLTPQCRKKVFSKEVHDIVKKCTEEICQKNNVVLEKFNSDKYHVYIVISYPPSINLSTLIGNIKGYSSRILRKHHLDLIQDKLWENHFWSPSYSVFSTGEAPLEKIKKYVENQGKEPLSPGNPNFKKNH